MAALLKICRGSDCRKYAKKLRSLGKELGGEVEVKTVKCLDICKGPVVLVHRGGRKYTFKKVRGKKLRRALAEFLLEGEMDEVLKSHLAKRK